MDKPPEVCWSDHAKERAQERFGIQIEPPLGLIQAVAVNKKTGEKFRVRQSDKVFICVNADNGITLIATVIKHKKYNTRKLKGKIYVT